MESSHQSDLKILVPAPLKVGNKVRFVLSASPLERDNILTRADILRSWGLEVDFAPHVFESTINWLIKTSKDYPTSMMHFLIPVLELNSQQGMVKDPIELQMISTLRQFAMIRSIL